MTTATIREKLHDFINTADDKKVEIIYSVVELLLTKELHFLDDKDFLKELKNQVNDFESGRVDRIPWEEIGINTKSN